MDETQERLLETAAQLFSQRGYAGISMRHIATAVGITQAAIYHHFASKDALYIDAISYLFDELTLGVSEQMAAIDEPVDRLTLVITRLLIVMDEDPRFRRIYLRELLEGDDDRLAALARNTFADFYEPLYTLMGELAPGTDSQLLIFSLTGMVFHHLETRKLAPHLPHYTPEKDDLPALATHITQLFLRGIGPT
jgi:AcrR family transcriptional regulator